jgi:hypothetical protein
MLPKFSRQHWIWIVILVIAIFYIFMPNSGITLILRQIFHTLLAFLLQMLG